MTLPGVSGTGQVFDPANHMRPELLEPRRPGEHVWMAVVTYVVSAENLRRGMDGVEQVLMDTENIAMVTFGCYVCEALYEKKLTFRKCPGEPPSSIMNPR